MQAPVHARSFTGTYPGLSNVIHTQVHVGLPLANPDVARLDNFFSTFAIWDTGATGSVITNRVVQELSLQPVGRSTIFGVGGEMQVNNYLVSIALPNNVIIPDVRVTECPGLTGDFEVLIGMDIIARGDFAISNFNGVTKFSFRIPSMGEIDFNTQIPTTAQPYSRAERREAERVAKKKGKNPNR